MERSPNPSGTTSVAGGTYWWCWIACVPGGPGAGTVSSDGVVTKSTSYAYDGLDRRVTKTVDTNGDSPGGQFRDSYVYDGDNIKLVFRDNDGDGPNGSQLKHRYLHGPAVDMILADETVYDLKSAGQTVWALADELGSIRDLVPVTNGFSSHVDYDPWGQVASGDLSADFLYGYAGRERDRESGLYFNRARYYDPAAGRFISQDPIGFTAGDANLYRYVGNDVANQTDPTGLYNTAL